MALSGLRHTENFAADERPKNWREGILRLYPNGKMPLTGLTSMMSERSVDDPEFYWWQKQLDNRRIPLGGNLNSSSGIQTITVTAGAFKVKEGDLLQSEQTGEVMRVAADPGSDTTLSVQRAFGGTSAASVTYAGTGVNPNLLIIGSAYEENSHAPTGVNFDPSKAYNYTQIFRDTLEMSRTAQKTRLRTGDQVKEARRECLEYHGIAMELAFLFGERSETVLRGNPVRTMRGIVNWIDSNNIKTVTSDYPGGLTATAFEEYMYNIFKFGSSDKLAFCGNRALLTMGQMVRKNSQYQVFANEKLYGMNVTKFVSPFGELTLKTHPLLNQLGGGTTGTGPYYGRESWLFVIDQANLKYVYLKGSDTSYQGKLEAIGVDGMKSGYLTECSIEVHHPTTHYLLKNLVLAAGES